MHCSDCTEAGETFIKQNDDRKYTVVSCLSVSKAV